MKTVVVPSGPVIPVVPEGGAPAGGVPVVSEASCEPGAALVPVSELLPQAAAIRATEAARAVRAILLLFTKCNETTSFVGLDVRTQMGRHGPGPL